MALGVRLGTGRGSHDRHWLGQLEKLRKGLTYWVTGRKRKQEIPFELKKSGKLPLGEWASADPDELALWALKSKIAWQKS